MTHFILIPGANHGGWWYAPVVEALAQAGHSADAVTLAGLDPEGPPAPGANLDTHVAQVVELLDGHDGPVVLVGHSYAGSVITAVADQRLQQVSALVYLDAFVPEDGDSAWAMTNDEQRDWYSHDSGETGLAVAPLPFFDDRARPHPLGTLMQRARLTGAWKAVPTKRYVAAADPEWLKHSPFVGVAARLRETPGWTVTDLASSHNFLANGPDTLVSLLLEHA